jgi:hypothetical protein
MMAGCTANDQTSNLRNTLCFLGIDMTPACFGIMCEKHNECARYHAVNGATREQEFIGTCLEEGKRVLFLRVEAVIRENT